MIAVGKQFLNGGHAGPAVGAGNDTAGIERMILSPDGPNAGDSGSGIDEDAIHIEKDGATDDLHGHYDSGETREFGK